MECATITSGVVIHKAAEAIALGLALKQGGIELQFARSLIVAEAALSPIAILIGWGMISTSILVQAIFMSLSVGTFLYIAIAEIIVEEFNRPSYKCEKFSAYMAAIVLIVLTQYLE